MATPNLSPGRPPGWSERQGGVPIPVMSSLCGSSRRQVVVHAASCAVRRQCDVHVLRALRDACTTTTTGRHDRLQRPAARLPLASCPFIATLLPCLPLLCLYLPLLCVSGGTLYYAIVLLFLRPRQLSSRTQLHSKDFCTAAVPTSPVRLRVIMGREGKGRWETTAGDC